MPLIAKSYFGLEKDGCVFGKQIGLPIIKPVIKGRYLVSNGVKAIAPITGNKRNFTNRDVEQAEVARRFQHVAVYLSDDNLIYTVTANGIKNLLIVIQDVKLMNNILRNSQYAMKGKSVRGQPDAVTIFF